MYEWQKEVAQWQLKDESRVLSAIKKNYAGALSEVEEKIRMFDADIKAKQDALALITDATRRERMMSEIQSKIYQRQYQKALKSQISAIYDKMTGEQYDTVKGYIEGCYENGYVGAMYDLQNQGIPIISPIDQSQVLMATVHDTKLSVPLYEALGQNVTQLKKVINQEISRGIASSLSYADIARNINKRSSVAVSKTFQIARTEGHRVTAQANYDAQNKAKSKGADVVKQWDAALDGRTRPDHALLDGQIRELDEPFQVNGHEAMYPGGFGIAKEDINCRCVSLTRARWALDDEELKELQDRAAYYGLDKTKDFNDFKGKYMKATDDVDAHSYKPNHGNLTDDEYSRNPWGLHTITGTHSIDDDVTSVNPNYSVAKKYKNNCGYCSVGYEMRRRGFDVEANPKMGLYTTEWQAMWDGFQPARVSATRKTDAVKELVDKIGSWGEGARGSIFVVWDGRSYGHYFNCEVRNGTVMFVDAQKGKIDCIDYFERVRPSSIQYGRVDDLELSDNVAKAVKDHK